MWKGKRLLPRNGLYDEVSVASVSVFRTAVNPVFSQLARRKRHLSRIIQSEALTVLYTSVQCVPAYNLLEFDSRGMFHLKFWRDYNLNSAIST